MLYRDDHLLIVDKPSGLLVHRGWANDKVTALSLAREVAGQWVHPAHRLDRGTSGVLVFALSSEVAAALQQQFSERSVDKRYLALVRGHCPTELNIDYPLAKDKGFERLPSVTMIRRLNTYELPSDEPYPRRYSWIEAHPKTGRAHQIRKHVRHIRHPIVGDVRYGKAEHNRFFRTEFQFHRLALHAKQLSLQHPVTRRPLHVHSPLPAALCRLSEQLQARTTPP